MNIYMRIINILVFMAMVSPSFAGEGKNNNLSNFVDEKGSISFPKGFALDMSLLGSWYVPEGEASGFHQVYTDSSSINEYKKSGQFPDGSVIVKELRHSKVGNYTTGSNISYTSSDIKQWFVMIKDSKNRFTDNPVWGDGWGWALFKPDDTSKNLATNYKTDCLGCHVPAKDKDWIYTEAYPILN